jgi:hypothetical protein
MISHHRLLAFLLGLGLTIGLIVTLRPATLSAQGQDKASKTQHPNLDQIPMVDFEKSAPSAPEPDPKKQTLRTVKGERYAKHVKGAIADRDTPEGMVLTSRYIQQLPAFPVSGSAIVALGEVVDAQAYLSGDKTGVYSEFSIRIEEVFKNDAFEPSFSGSLVVAERYGGRIRFPSGRVTYYGNREQGMPRQGGRYVFFLSCDEKRYSILTGYELRSGRVYPLDGRNAPGRDPSLSVGDEYEDTDATRFLGDLQRALVQFSQMACSNTCPGLRAPQTMPGSLSIVTPTAR